MNFWGYYLAFRYDMSYLTGNDLTVEKTDLFKECAVWELDRVLGDTRRLNWLDSYVYMTGRVPAEIQNLATLSDSNARLAVYEHTQEVIGARPQLSCTGDPLRACEPDDLGGWRHTFISDLIIMEGGHSEVWTLDGVVDRYTGEAGDPPLIEPPLSMLRSIPIQARLEWCTDYEKVMPKA